MSHEPVPLASTLAGAERREAAPEEGADTVELL